MLCPFSFVVIPAKAGIPKRLPSLEKFVEDSRPRLSSSLLGLAVAILIARVFLFATLQAFGNPTLPEPLRTEQTLNGTWRISKIVGSKSAVPLDRDSGFLAGYHRPAFDDSGWAKINIPSNW